MLQEEPCTVSGLNPHHKPDMKNRLMWKLFSIQARIKKKKTFIHNKHLCYTISGPEKVDEQMVEAQRPSDVEENH